MAERRMFAKSIIDSDLFLDMPVSAQCLYFHLAMRADDEGFINNPKKIAKMVNASDDDSKLLIAKQFIIPFDSGIVVIKHWRIHNYIRGDRLAPTKCFEERSMLECDESGAYRQYSLDVSQMSGKCQADVSQMSGKCQADVSQMSGRCLTQDSIGKFSVVQGSVVKGDCKGGNDSASAKPTRHRYGQYQNVLLSDAELEKLKNEFPDWENRIERLSEYIESTGKKYSSHLATIRVWARKETDKLNKEKEDRRYIADDLPY